MGSFVPFSCVTQADAPRTNRIQRGVQWLTSRVNADGTTHNKTDLQQGSGVSYPAKPWRSDHQTAKRMYLLRALLHKRDLHALPSIDDAGLRS